MSSNTVQEVRVRQVHEIDSANAELSFSDYNAFVKSMKVFPEKYAIVYPALGMIGEAGEVSEKVKKWLRGDRELDKPELVKELGDVLWYITALADDLGYTLEDVVNMNVEKLSSRRDRGVVKGSGDNR
jgi:NTP pyrophosphatase (non-canonical NTP hydrolase)